jgi:DNA-binding LytR/AlgR family response regulator
MNNCNIYVKDLTLNMGSHVIPKGNFMNIIVADDEILNRQATVRIINSISKTLDVKINIIEAEDGVETAYLVYKAATQGVKISMIFSDENMNFFSGTQSSKVVRDITNKKRIENIPFYLVTAYDNNFINILNVDGVTQILDKPLSKQKGQEIIYEFCKIFRC